MSKLYIEKLNASYMRVYSDDLGLEQEISEYFSFEVPGAKWMPAYKSGRWDGFVRLYNRQKRTLLLGLKDVLTEYCDNSDILYESNFQLIPNEITDERIKELTLFIDSLKLASKGKLLEIRDYQYSAIIKAIHDQRISMLSPTSSGKSAMIYSLVRWAIENDQKVLIVVPNQGLVNQLFSDFKDYSSVNNWDVDKYVQKIMGGFSKADTHQCKISTWQSLVKLDAKYFKEFDALFIDEYHLATGQSIQTIAEKCVNADFRVGLTGTIDKKVINRTLLTGICGPIYEVTTTKKLMDIGSVTKLKINAVLLKYSKEESKLLKGLKYPQEMKYLVENEKRNNFIAKTAVKTKGNTLVLFQFISHGKKLYDLICNMTDRPVFYISGEVKADDREILRNKINDYEDAIIVASVQTTSTGVNIPALDNVIFASPTKSIYRVLQSIGRVLRLRDGKLVARLIDIGDKMSSGKSINTTCLHFIERIKIYVKEKFEYKITEIDF